MGSGPRSRGRARGRTFPSLQTQLGPQATGPFGTKGSTKGATVQTARRVQLCPRGRAAAGTRSALIAALGTDCQGQRQQVTAGGGRRGWIYVWRQKRQRTPVCPLEMPSTVQNPRLSPVKNHQEGIHLLACKPHRTAFLQRERRVLSPESLLSRKLSPQAGGGSREHPLSLSAEGGVAAGG